MMNTQSELKHFKEEKTGKTPEKNNESTVKENNEINPFIEMKKIVENKNQNEFTNFNNQNEKMIPKEFKDNFQPSNYSNHLSTMYNDNSKSNNNEVKFLPQESKFVTLKENEKEKLLDEKLKNSLQAAFLKSKSFVPSNRVEKFKAPILNVNAVPYEYAPPKFKLVSQTNTFRIHEFLKFQINPDQDIDWKFTDKSIIEKKNQLNTSQVSSSVSSLSNTPLYPSKNYPQEFIPTFPIQAYPSNSQMIFVPQQVSYNYPNYIPYNPSNENQHSFNPRGFRPQ